MSEVKQKQIGMWIPVELGRPVNNSKVIGYDTDSLTPEKKLLFLNGKFLFIAHGVELDHTEFISKWKYDTSPSA